MQSFYKRFSVYGAFGLLLAVLAVNAFIMRRQLGVQMGDEARVMHSRQVLFEAEQTLSLLKDAETGQRGYLYTGDPAYLAPYSSAIGQIEPHMDNLARLIADDPRQQERIVRLRDLAHEKINELARTISLYQSGKAYEARAAVLSHLGKSYMDDIRRVMAQMEQEESSLETARIAAYQKSQRNTIASIYLASCLAAFGLVLLAYYIVREIRLREKHAEEIRAREEWFRVTLTSIGDAVIATDREGAVTFLNPVAETLTGIDLARVKGRNILEVFSIVNERTRKPAENPVEKVLEVGHVVGLANHTALVRKDGTETPIEDSAAPIRGVNGELLGVVLVFRDVTEERRAERESRLLTSIVASSEDAILSNDLNGDVRSWNRSAQRMFGYAADEMVGQPVLKLYPPGRENEMREILDRIQRGEEVEHYHTARCRKDGTLFDVSVSVSPLFDENGEIAGASKIVRDITAEVQAQREVAAHRERLRVTLRSIGDAVIATDKEGRVSYLNPVAEQLTGWGSQEAEGCPLTEVMRIVNEKTRHAVENPVERVLQEGRVVGLANHTVLIARDGTEVPIEDSAAPIRDANGELTGVVLVFRDVTNERKAQEAMRRTERLASAGRLSATLAHEINNPLQAVAGLVYLSRTMPGLPKTVAWQLSLAEEELRRVAHIARQTLGFYKGSQATESVDMQALVDSVFALYSGKLKSKDIRIERHFGDCPPVQAASGELGQVISHLVTNAADAVHNQGTIAITLGSIEQAGHTILHILVEDDGPGIPPEHIPHLFEPFFTTKQDVGTGLGLWLTKEIVERHGGTIHLHPRSDGGRGAAFTILLPCTPGGVLEQVQLNGDAAADSQLSGDLLV